MGTEGVFAIGVSGMGPALSPTGERIVRSKMKARDRMLEDLESRGVNVDALVRRHHDSPGCECGRNAANEDPCAHLDSLEQAQALVLRQKGEIAHLKHQAAVQENKILLLRKALEAMRGGQ